jgi:hypothetical protein
MFRPKKNQKKEGNGFQKRGEMKNPDPVFRLERKKNLRLPEFQLCTKLLIRDLLSNTKLGMVRIGP